jgi:hypothetical protein
LPLPSVTLSSCRATASWRFGFKAPMRHARLRTTPGCFQGRSLAIIRSTKRTSHDAGLSFRGRASLSK